eukprot:15326807-Alexandrium_andersonii.AAC.1
MDCRCVRANRARGRSGRAAIHTLSCPERRRSRGMTPSWPTHGVSQGSRRCVTGLVDALPPQVGGLGVGGVFVGAVEEGLVLLVGAGAYRP